MARCSVLTPEQKSAIVRQSNNEPEWNQNKLGQWVADTFHLDFVPSQPTISIILRQAGKSLKSRGRKKKKQTPDRITNKVVRCPQIEKAMLQWLEKKIKKDEAVTVTAVQTKAEELEHKVKVTVEGFVVSKMWVDSFMRHHVLNFPFGLSELDDMESNEKVETILCAPAAKKVEKTMTTNRVGKAGKTSRRVAKKLVGRKDSCSSVGVKATCVPVRKRKRDGKENESARQVKGRK
ncbi:unnamed protein product [Peronospora belbahrii]|uniref:HTH CENPB-type domain-containing protein n=1 Tax=Peronospora belbahrii TaxID=622444 RepID=A0AAU9LBR8_9STRA|nr:unnamed protein product [Peronospora belbahrii]CAH0518078.1 unnamed protein product [Peronospora belbahrii]